MNIRTDKSALRRTLRAARYALDKNRRVHAECVTNRLLKRFIRRSKRIGVYWPVGSELCLNGFIQTALVRGAKLYLPYIEPHSLRLWFTPYQHSRRAAERQFGKKRVDIPQFAGKKIRVHCLNVLLVPLVGIDRQGYRLGQGGGYYDVSLAAVKGRLKPFTVGVGFACQLCDKLPHEAHDIKLDAFVCEHAVYFFSQTG